MQPSPGDPPECGRSPDAELWVICFHRSRLPESFGVVPSAALIPLWVLQSLVGHSQHPTSASSALTLCLCLLLLGSLTPGRKPSRAGSLSTRLKTTHPGPEGVLTVGCSHRTHPLLSRPAEMCRLPPFLRLPQPRPQCQALGPHTPATQGSVCDFCSSRASCGSGGQPASLASALVPLSLEVLLR